MKDKIQNLLAMISKLEEMEVPPDRQEEIESILDEAADGIDNFIFDLED